MKYYINIFTIRKIVIYLILLIGSTAMAQSSTLEEAPVTFRFGIFADSLKKYIEVPTGKKLRFVELNINSNRYHVFWLKPDQTVKQTSKNLSYEALLKKANSFSKEVFPNIFVPKAENMTGSYKVLIKDIGWVWFFEFSVPYHGYIAGAGFKPSLIIPIAMDGTCLAEIDLKTTK